jgi:hypothetical protein
MGGVDSVSYEVLLLERRNLALQGANCESFKLRGSGFTGRCQQNQRYQAEETMKSAHGEVEG